MIELYIERNLVDLKDDITIPFTFESIDPDKLSTIKNSFSKTIDLPGTLNNNNIFGDIFRVDRYISSVQDNGNVGFQYDPHKKAEYILVNNGSVINSGYCTLNEILIQEYEKITYKITLYGGLGNFFYNLMYKEDGNYKTLYDLIWNWKSKESTIYSQPLTPAEENTQVLFNCNPRLVAQSYSYLKPSEDITEDYEEYNPETGNYQWHYADNPAWWNLEYNERYKITEIDKDIVFVPSYSGYYNDFDSKHIIYNTRDRASYFSPKVRTTDTDNKLNQSFPEGYNDTSQNPNVVYQTIGKTLSHLDSNRYGLISVSRDLDPFEAGDLRISEMPVAIRLSKLMRTLSEPWNNGGYKVEWDKDITDSYYWNYSWVLLGKLNQESNSDSYNIDIEKLSYDDNIKYVWRGRPYYNVDNGTPFWSSSRLITGNLNNGSYTFKINTKPSISFSTNYMDSNILNHINEYKLVSSIHTVIANINYYRQNLFCLVHKILKRGPEETTLAHYKSILDVFYITQNSTISKFGDGLDNTEILTERIKRKIKSFSNLQIPTIDQVRIHNINPSLGFSTEDNLNYIDAKFSNELISTDFDIEEDNTAIEIIQFNIPIFVDYSINDVGNINYGIGIWGVDNPSDVPVNIVDNNYFSFIDNRGNYLFYIVDPTVVRETMIKCSFNESSTKTGIFLKNTAGLNIIELTKSMLFANSESPAKYLIDFCKMMNYRFVLDDLNKKINIYTLKNYYKNEIEDIDNLVDISRDRSIKIINTKNKLINFGLDTEETYPVSLYNRISKDKFNEYKIDTGIEWNQDTTNLLNDLIYKNIIDWQQSSVFYNLKPQFPRPYITPTVSWTLFNADTTSLQKKELINPGYGMQVSTLTETIDYMPKISLFNRDNKYVDTANNLIFLNGFVKNYDYTPTDYIEYKPNNIIRSKYIDTSGNITNSSYQDIYVYNVIENYKYCITCSYTSGYSSYVANYYDSNDVRIGTEYPQQDQTYNRAELTLPEGTTVIKINFRKDDTEKKKLESLLYTISSRLSVSQDVAEQFYLNGSRCYMNDFSYLDNFIGWGRWSDRNYSADSWVLPYFSRDLYNQRVNDISNQVFAPVATLDGKYFYIYNGLYMTVDDPDWEIRTYFIADIDNPHFWAKYLPQDNKNVLAKYDRFGNFLGTEGNISLNQYIFENASINTLGGSVIELRMNVYKPYSNDTYMKGDVILKSKHWEPSQQVLASWNLVRQDNTRMYDLKNTVFIRDNNYTYRKQISNINSINNNEYKFNPLIDIQNTIFETNWKDLIKDQYDKNSRDITCYIDLSNFGSPNDILRKFYKWQGFYWIITKIENFQYGQIGKDKFTKCTLHKILKLDNYINKPEIIYEEVELTPNNVWNNSRFEFVGGMLYIVGDPNWEMRSYRINTTTMRNVRFWSQYPSDTSGVYVFWAIDRIGNFVNQQYSIDSNQYNFYGERINIENTAELRMNVWKANSSTTRVKASVISNQ